MAKSTLQAFVSATRQMLTLQLFIGVAAVGLAGWTASVTTQLIRERNALSARVLQLEAELNKAGVEAPPPMVTGRADAAPTPTLEAPPMPAETTTQPAPAQPSSETPTTTETTQPGKPPRTETTTTATTAPFDPGSFIRNVLPPPALSLVVLHVRAEGDRAAAERIARDLASTGAQVSVEVSSPRDTHAPAYAYFDPRQANAAAAIAAQLRAAARHAEIAAWTADLPGTALASSERYSANRVDFLLPALPATTAPTSPTRNTFRDRAAERRILTPTPTPTPIR